MKTAIYIEDGRTQLVLTPETDWEKQVIRCVEEGAQSVQIRRGSFYETRLGHFRQGSDDSSLILCTNINAKDSRGISAIPTP